MFVDRDGSNNVIATYSVRQYVGQEELSGAALAAYELDVAKADKKAELNIAYNAACAVFVTYNANTYQADKTMRDNLTEVSAYVASGGLLTSFPFRTATNQNISLNITDVNAIIALIGDQKIAAASNLHTKESAVDACTTIAQVQTITW